VSSEKHLGPAHTPAAPRTEETLLTRPLSREHAGSVVRRLFSTAYRQTPTAFEELAKPQETRGSLVPGQTNSHSTSGTVNRDSAVTRVRPLKVRLKTG
jgi:hypothetical protein